MQPPLSIQPNAQLTPTQQPLTPEEAEQRQRIAAQMMGRQPQYVSPTTIGGGLASIGSAIGDRRAAGIPLDAAPPMFGGPSLPQDFWRTR
jgi:hypothetical protein